MNFQSRVVSESKALGAFYTPPFLADALAGWIVRTGYERILEPSVGEGSLINAAARQSNQIVGCPQISILACDVNPSIADAVLSVHPRRCDVRIIDFLTLDPGVTGLFDGILTNPPFTRNHSLPAIQRAELRSRFCTSGAAGLWVHFLLHALDFLKVGGRLAAVIPASGLFSDYGRVALNRICQKFSHVEIRQFIDKPFWVNSAEERGALFLAEGYKQGVSTLPTATWWSSNGAKAKELTASDRTFSRLFEKAISLEQLAKLSIGAVTGHNRIFLLNERDRLDLGIDMDDVKPIVSRVRQIPGLSISVANLAAQAAAGENTYLLLPRSLHAKGSGVRRRLAQIPAERRRATLWFSKRTVWWQVDVPPCDAVFTYMNDQGPRLVLVDEPVGCTNTLHSVSFFRRVSRQQQMAASLTILSTFGQLAAERVGRSYGGGILKLELKEARRMPVLPSFGGLTSFFRAADEALRRKDYDAATEIADEAMVVPHLGRNWRSHLKKMQVELSERRSIRQARY